MNRKQIVTIFIPLILIVLVTSYLWLGGFSEIIWEKEDDTNILIYGKYYEGEYGDDFIRETFLSIKEKLENNEWEGDLTVVYYNKPEETEGQVKNFIGAIVTDSIYSDDGFEYRLFSSKAALRATLEVHNFVMPNPKSVYEDANQKAQENQLELDDIFMEIYHSNSHIEILFLGK